MKGNKSIIKVVNIHIPVVFLHFYTPIYIPIEPVGNNEPGLHKVVGHSDSLVIHNLFSSLSTHRITDVQN